MSRAPLLLRALGGLTCVAALLAIGDVHAAGDEIVRELVEGIAPREGVEVRTLHVVPLVSVAPDVRDGAGELPAAAGWVPVEGRAGLVELTAPENTPPAIVPAGTLLVGGERELLLEWTEPLTHDGRRALPTRICDVRREPAAPGARRIGPLAPLEQRKLLMLNESADTWGMLLRIQQIVSGVPTETQTVAALLQAEDLRQCRAETEAALQRIPRAYAGRTRGHVAFFGFRPVEIVIARTPADYQAIGPRYMSALAVSHAIWERALGLEERQLAPAAPADYIPQAVRVLRTVATARGKRRPRLAGQRGAWRDERAKVVAGDGRDPFVVRVVSSDADTPVLLEAIEDGDRIIHPLPLRKVGGRPVDEGPNIKGGALTDEYLERLMERRAEREAGRR